MVDVRYTDERAELKDGSVIQMGGIRLQFKRGGDSNAMDVA